MDSTEHDDERKYEVNDTYTMKFYKKRNRTPAFVTEFMNGRVTQDGANVLKFESFKSSDNKRCLNANNGRLNYTGVSDGNQNVPLQYFVGVRDKKTGKMKLYDTSFFRMKPQLNINKFQSAVSTPKTYRESVNELTANFGSKTKKRALNAVLKNMVKDPSLDDAVTLGDIASVDSTPEIQPTPIENMSYLPPQNREATTVHDVFDISSLISPAEDVALDNEATELMSDEACSEKIDSFNSYVKAHFESGKMDFIKMKYLIYYNYLVQFQQLGYADLRRRDPAPNIPEPFKNRIISNFTMVSTTAKNTLSRSTPPQYKDKLVAHILVMALLIDDFTIDLTEVANDLRLYALPKLTIIAQALGCHISVRTLNDGAKTKIAVLKLPLYVMTLKHAKKTAFK